MQLYNSIWIKVCNLTQYKRRPTGQPIPTTQLSWLLISVYSIWGRDDVRQAGYMKPTMAQCTFLGRLVVSSDWMLMWSWIKVRTNWLMMVGVFVGVLCKWDKYRAFVRMTRKCLDLLSPPPHLHCSVDINELFKMTLNAQFKTR